jgi:uncharacterized damage-inducible protein DinB
MNSLDLLRRLHEHRTHVNGLLLHAAETVSGEQLRTPFPIGQGSIWRSLVHLYAGEYVWLGTLEGDPHATLPGDLPDKLPGNQAGEETIRSLADLKTKWHELAARWQRYLDELAEESLDEIVFKKPSGSPDRSPMGTKRGDVILHVSLHAQYTTAQVVNMFRQLSVQNLPDVMLITLARRQHADHSRQ